MNAKKLGGRFGAANGVLEQGRMLKTTTVVLADDHTVMRQGLRSLLEEQPDLKVVGEASDGMEAVKLVEALRPDVLVVDMAMPGMNGVDVIRRVRETSPGTVAVVLSMYGVEGYVTRAIRAGARAYVLKDSTGYELVHAIREAVSGRRFLSRSLSDHIVDSFLKEQTATSLDALMLLTNREQEVLRQVAVGGTSRQIADKLNLSARTVEFQRGNIMRKLNLHNHQDLIKFCLRAGLAPETERATGEAAPPHEAGSTSRYLGPGLTDRVARSTNGGAASGLSKPMVQ